jgi:leucyl/phenylalanyl-tRNA--protein transferase
LEEIKDPHFVVEAYRKGYFPMAEDRYGEVYWHSPDPRAIIPLQNVKIPKSLNKKIKRGDFTFTINYDFPYVIEKCADRSITWINDEIIDTYTHIHEMGYANSVETWHDGEITGGLYGVTIGGAFFGESMFNDVTDAAKAAFYYLTERLKLNRFMLLDSQYINPFTAQLGAVEIPKQLYMTLLRRAISLDRKLK